MKLILSAIGLRAVRTAGVAARIVATLGLVVAGVGEGHAQEFPVKPIRIVVAFAAGGAGDIVARTVGQKMAEELGKPVLIENKAGAGGMIGAQAVAQSTADGHTLLLAANSFTINPVLREKVPYDPIRNFAPVAMLATSPMLLAVPTEFPAKTLDEFINLVKSQPGKIRFAAAGPGASPHIASEQMKSAMNLDMLYVPYLGGAQATLALASAQVDAGFTNYSEAIPFLQGGKIRVLAVTALKRSDHLRNVPTVAESGYPGFETFSWYGLLAPAGTPRAAAARLNAAANRALMSPEVLEKLDALGFYPASTTLEQFDAYVRSELNTYAKVIKKVGIKVE